MAIINNKIILYLNDRQRGFALLVAVVFTSVLLSIGLFLGSLDYKQTTLASAALESQYAFYAADAAMECILYFDQQKANFPYAANMDNPVLAVTCDGLNVADPVVNYYGRPLPEGSLKTFKYKLDLDTGGGPTRRKCADVTMYKYEPSGNKLYKTYIFSQGYSVSCSQLGTGIRYASRGLQAHY